MPLTFGRGCLLLNITGSKIPVVLFFPLLSVTQKRELTRRTGVKWFLYPGEGNSLGSFVTFSCKSVAWMWKKHSVHLSWGRILNYLACYSVWSYFYWLVVVFFHSIWSKTLVGLRFSVFQALYFDFPLYRAQFCSQLSRLRSIDHNTL